MSESGMKAREQDEAPRTVLIVDDDVTFRTTLAASLKRRGLRPILAGSVAEGLSEARIWDPDFATVDLRMPGDGLELVRRLRSEFPSMRVIVLTGFGTIQTAVLAVKLGAIQYITKPATADQILAAFGGEGTCEGESTSSLDAVEWEHLNRVLAECSGNVSEAARRLGMHRRSLQRKLQRNRPLR